MVQDFTIHSSNVKQHHLVSTVNIEEKYFLFISSETNAEDNLYKVALNFFFKNLLNDSRFSCHEHAFLGHFSHC